MFRAYSRRLLVPGTGRFWPPLDLTRVPPVPSFFDPEARQSRSSIVFLTQSAEEISRRIERDDRIHLEYIPTQVVNGVLQARASRRPPAWHPVRQRTAHRRGLH